MEGHESCLLERTAHDIPNKSPLRHQRQAPGPNQNQQVPGPNRNQRRNLTRSPKQKRSPSKRTTTKKTMSGDAEATTLNTIVPSRSLAMGGLFFCTRSMNTSLEARIAQDAPRFPSAQMLERATGAQGTKADRSSEICSCSGRLSVLTAVAERLLQQPRPPPRWSRASVFVQGQRI